ncbi:MAG TPA: TolC family protein [bacterium]|nr:TolC family protein [bacterium]
MRRIILPVAIVFLTGFFVAVNADPNASDLLTEEKALELALANNHELAALNGEVRECEARAGFAAYDINNPELRAQDISTRYLSEDEDHELQLGLRWQPPELGELGLRKQEEIVALWETKVRLQQRRNELIATVRLAYAEQTMLPAYAEIAERRVALERQRFAVIERKVTLGHSSVIDQVKARKRIIKAQNDAAKIRQRNVNSRMRFGVLTGVHQAYSVKPAAPPILRLDRDHLSVLARRYRSELTLAQQRAELARREQRAQRGKLVPWFSFVEVGQHFESDDQDWQELRLGVQLPLFNWNVGNLRAASMAVERGGVSAAAVSETIEMELSVALARYETVLTQWRSLHDEHADYLPQISRLIDAAEQQDTLPTDEKIDLQLAELECLGLQLDLRLELIEAAMELCAAVGVDRWEELVE